MWAIARPVRAPVDDPGFRPSYASPDWPASATRVSVGQANSGRRTARRGIRTKSAARESTPPDSVFAFDGQTYYFERPRAGRRFGTLGPSGETPEVTLPTSASAPRRVGSSLYFRPRRSSTKATQFWSRTARRPVRRWSRISARSRRSVLGIPLEPDRRDGTLFFTVAGTDGLEELWKSNGTAGYVAGQGPGHEPGSYTVTVMATCTRAPPVGRDCSPRSGPISSSWRRTARMWAGRRHVRRETQLVKDINPGPAGSDPQNSSRSTTSFISRRTTARARRRTSSGPSDGTAGGTVMVASFSPGVNQGSAALHPGSTDFATLGSDAPAPARGRHPRPRALGDRRDPGGHQLARAR